MGFSRQDYWSGGWSWVHEYKNILILWTPHGSPLPAGRRRRPSPQLLFWMPLPVSPYPHPVGRPNAADLPIHVPRGSSLTLCHLDSKATSLGHSWAGLHPTSPSGLTLPIVAGRLGGEGWAVIVFLCLFQFSYISLWPLPPNVCLSVWSTGLRMHVKSHKLTLGARVVGNMVCYPNATHSGPPRREVS